MRLHILEFRVRGYSLLLKHGVSIKLVLKVYRPELFSNDRHRKIMYRIMSGRYIKVEKVYFQYWQELFDMLDSMPVDTRVRGTGTGRMKSVQSNYKKSVYRLSQYNRIKAVILAHGGKMGVSDNYQMLDCALYGMIATKRRRLNILHDMVSNNGLNLMPRHDKYIQAIEDFTLLIGLEL